MKNHIVIDGNAFYEVDDECMEEKRKKKMCMEKSAKEEGQRQPLCVTDCTKRRF